MNREKTDHPNIIKIGSIYWWKIGGREGSMKTKDLDEAKRNIRYFLVKFDKVRNLNIRLKTKELKKPYFGYRKAELDEGSIRLRTYNEALEIFTKVIEPLFGNYAPANIDSVVWDEVRRKKKFKNQVNVRKTMQHFLKWCVKNRYAQGVPILDVKTPERRPRRILTPQEMKAIYSNATGSLRIFIAMALFNGLRRTEIMTMTWERANLVERWLFIPKEISKTKQARKPSMADEVFNVLAARRIEFDNHAIKTPWVFPHAFDKSRHGDLSGLKTAWRTCKKRAGLEDVDITWHDLRATCEKYAHMNLNVTPTQLEKFFGANIDVQRKIYVSLDHEDLRGVEKSLTIQQLESSVGKRMVNKSENNDVDNSKDAKQRKK